MTNPIETAIRELDAAARAEVPCPDLVGTIVASATDWTHPTNCTCRGTGTILRPDLAWLRDVLRGKAAVEGEVCEKCKGRRVRQRRRGTEVWVETCLDCGGTGTGRIGAEPGWDGLLVPCKGEFGGRPHTPIKQQCPDCHGTGWVLNDLLRQLVEAGETDAAVGFIERRLRLVGWRVWTERGSRPRWLELSNPLGTTWDSYLADFDDELGALLDALGKAAK